MLDCSEQWALEIAAGISIRRVIDDALQPLGADGGILIVSADNAAPVHLRTDPVEHRGFLEPAPAGAGHVECVIRIAPEIELTHDSDNLIRLHTGTALKNIVAHSMIEPGETAFLPVPIPPLNPAGAFQAGQLTAFKAGDQPARRLDCSEQWRINVDEGAGITLKKLKKSEVEPERGEILSARVRQEGKPLQPLMLTADKSSHTATVQVGGGGLTEFLIRVADGIRLEKDSTTDKGVRLVTDKPKNIVDSPLKARSEIAFVVSEVPQKPRQDVNEADMEDIA